MLDGSLRVAPLKHIEAHGFLPVMLAARPRRGGGRLAPFRAQGVPWRGRGGGAKGGEGRAKGREEQRLQDGALYGRSAGRAACFAYDLGCNLCCSAPRPYSATQRRI